MERQALPKKRMVMKPKMVRRSPVPLKSEIMEQMSK